MIFPFEGICIERGMTGREIMHVHAWATCNNIKVRYSFYNLKNFLPVGSVGFVQESLNKTINPVYYPSWCKPIIKRKVWQSDYSPSKACFVKPDVYKLFDGYVKGKTCGDGGAYLGGYWCSDIVEFKNEWRLYICDGEILDTGWYQGLNEDEECPKIDLDLTGVYGALDIGETKDGIQLVEFQHPFSIGWYGNNHEAYVKFLSEGYLKLLNNEWKDGKPI